MSERNVAPGLLLAMPQLPDPNFSRSVVLMIEHDTWGSWGLVVNQPAETLVSEVLDQLDVHWNGPTGAVVWRGGPVEPQRGCVLHEPVDPPLEEEALEVASGIQLSTLPDQLSALATRPPQGIRFLLGYAGWGSRQLETEMAEGSWLMAPATASLVFGSAGRMWEAAIESLGIDPASLVPASGVH